MGRIARINRRRRPSRIAHGYGKAGLPTWVADFNMGVFRGSGGRGTEVTIPITLSTPVVVMDSDGLLKWSAHNLVSDSVPSVATWEVNGATENDGADGYEVISAGAAWNRARDSYYTFPANIKHTTRVKYKAGTSGKASVLFYANSGANQFTVAGAVGSLAQTILSGGTIHSIVNKSLGGDVYEVTVVFEFDADSYAETASLGPYSTVTGETVIVLEANTYRSDLGGMQDNPDTGDSYVPTTSSAVYARPIEYDTSGNRLGMPIAPGRTNLIADGNDFVGGSWTAGSTVVAAQATGPDGNLSMSKITNASGAAADQIINNITLATSTTYGVPIYIKEFSASAKQRFGVYDTGAGWIGYVEVTWASGVPSTAASSGASNIKYRPTKYTGVYRLEFEVTTPASGLTGSSFRIHPDRNAVTGAGVYAAFAQVETDYPSAYIPTNGSTQTRNAVQVKTPKGYVGTDAELASGTWYVEVADQYGVTSGIILNTGTSDSPFYQGAGDNIAIWNGSYITSGSAVFDGATLHKMSIGFVYGTGFSIASDGRNAVTAYSNYINSNPPTDFWWLQKSDQSLMPGGILRRAIFFPDRMSDADIKSITDATTAFPS